MRSGEQVGLYGKGGNQASNIYLCWVCPGWGQTFHLPFPFPSALGDFLGMVVPGPTLIHPSPDPPRQMQEGRSRRQGKVGGAPFDLI